MPTCLLTYLACQIACIPTLLAKLLAYLAYLPTWFIYLVCLPTFWHAGLRLAPYEAAGASSLLGEAAGVRLAASGGLVVIVL